MRFYVPGEGRIAYALPNVPARGRDLQKATKRATFCPLRGHSVGRMQYAPTMGPQKKVRLPPLFQLLFLAHPFSYVSVPYFPPEGVHPDVP